MKLTKASRANCVRTFTTCIALAAASYSAIAGTNFEGLWVTCWDTPSEGQPTFELVEVKREGAGYRVVQEWGQNYAASGIGKVNGNTLTARGCTSFRGEGVDEKCAENNAPVIFVLTAAQANAKPKSLMSALKKYEPVRASPDFWSYMGGLCEEIAARKRSKTN